MKNNLLGRQWLQWSIPGRFLIVTLSATSIWCLLAEFYGICSMQTFTFLFLFPATVAIFAIAIRDRTRGDGQLWRAVVMGGLAGFAAACAYDVFRLPFVFAHEWGMDAVVPPLKLFKVFPKFGAMILGEATDQPNHSLAAHLTGWAYHFSNGVSFGVLYLAMVGDARRRSWWWAVVLAMGLELAMLLTPYPAFFSIPVTPTFVAVTLTAHLVFGVVLGLLCKRWVVHPQEELIVTLANS